MAARGERAETVLMTPRATASIVLALALLVALPARAQSRVQAGAGSVSTAVRVGLVIPPRLRFRVAQQARLDARGDTTRYVMDVEVAANLPWSLHATPADGAGEGAPVLRVRDGQGAWHTVRDGAPMVALAADQPPSNWRAVRVEVEVIGAQGPRSRPVITFDLQPAQR